MVAKMVAKIDNVAKVDIPTNHYINPCHTIQGLKSFASNQVKFIIWRNLPKSTIFSLHDITKHNWDLIEMTMMSCSNFDFILYWHKWHHDTITSRFREFHNLIPPYPFQLHQTSWKNGTFYPFGYPKTAKSIKYQPCIKPIENGTFYPFGYPKTAKSIKNHWFLNPHDKINDQ